VRVGQCRAILVLVRLGWNRCRNSTVGSLYELKWLSLRGSVTNRSNPRDRLRVLAGIVVILGACSDSAGPLSDLEPIELAVRMHLVQSEELDELNVRLSDAEVTDLLAAVNEIWEQAGVVWSLESIVREDALNDSLFQSALTDPDVSPVSVITSVLPAENFRPDIWNVFMIRDFGGEVGGVYLGTQKLVISAELDPNGERDINSGMSRILAHELGHSLSLFHVECEEEGNLMAGGCLLGTRTLLNATQIERARLRAEWGMPF
jgi:hypothetical protein